MRLPESVRNNFSEISEDRSGLAESQSSIDKRLFLISLFCAFKVLARKDEECSRDEEERGEEEVGEDGEEGTCPKLGETRNSQFKTSNGIILVKDDILLSIFGHMLVLQNSALLAKFDEVPDRDLPFSQSSGLFPSLTTAMSILYLVFQFSVILNITLGEVFPSMHLLPVCTTQSRNFNLNLI
jgi:hypothetical protein